ncbi:MAG TPA: hypothetical protein VGR28_00045 [Candidatus Thermoplasmatota archaeon]|jgi:hypothetical protein|nr:hypothetical protein [Candidatus Thermoplasmatota archaeon]
MNGVVAVNHTAEAANASEMLTLAILVVLLLGIVVVMLMKRWYGA